MSQLSRFGVSLQHDLLEAFDKSIGGQGYQNRFEPAQRDGHNVPAEFIYIYRFRLQR